MDPTYQYELEVTDAALDENRHVNNVAYVQWMQEAAIRHSEATGCTRMTRAVGATWVADFRKVRSLRRYKFIRRIDQTLLAEGETDWVFVDAATGRPRAVPQEIQRAFVVVFEPQPPQADA